MYRKLSKDGEEIDVITVQNNSGSREIKINSKLLRDYLAARRMTLLRQHDHRRFSNQSLTDVFGKQQNKEFIFQDSLLYNYKVIVSNERLPTNEKCFSRLLGRDIIKPFKKPDYSELWFSDEWNTNKQFCKFIVKLDYDGNPIEETCNEKELNKISQAKYLTPIFFKRDVLKKYYDNPSKYSVSVRSIHCLDLWDLQIDVNKKGLVYVWLGDLGHIPFKEQQYWKQYNVPPEGGITEHRWKTDFLALFVDPKDPIFHFKRAYEKVQEHFQAKYGFELFLKLAREDEHCYSTLHIPVSNEQMELDQQIQNLAKRARADSLNQKSLSYESNKSIDALEKFLGLKVGSIKAHELVEPFRMIQNLRSSGSAHRKGKEYVRNIERYGLDEFSNQKKFILLLNKVKQSLDSLLLI